MRYKPLLLALLIGFASPSFAAKDAPKEKAAPVKKSVKDKKDAEPAKKEAAKDKAKPAAKNTKDKADDKPVAKSKKETAEAAKNERTKERRNDKETKKQDKADKNKKGEAKAEEKAGKAVPAKTEPVKGKDKAADKPAAQNNVKAAAQNNVKAKKEAAELPKKDEAAAKQDKKSVEKKADKADKKTAAADSDDFKAAVTAAANDLESKKSLRSRNEGFIIHVNTTLKQLQQSRINLSAINRQQRDAWDKFQKLNADLNYLKTQVSNTRAQISRFVSGNYKNSQPNAVALFLKNAEPGQKTRFLRYTRYINTANDQVIKDLEKQQKELAAQEQKINNELAYLKKLQVNIQSSLRRQGVTNTAEQAESRRQNAQMAKDAQKKINHKENEQRLNNLLKDLDKHKAEQRRQEAEARKKAAEADDGIDVVFADDGFGSLNAAQQHQGQGEFAQQPFAAHAFHGDEFQRDVVLRHEALFHAVVTAEPDNVVSLLLQGLGDGEGGEDVSACAACHQENGFGSHGWAFWLGCLLNGSDGQPENCFCLYKAVLV